MLGLKTSRNLSNVSAHGTFFMIAWWRIVGSSLPQLELKMIKKPMPTKAPAEQVAKDVRRATRKLHSSEEKIRIVLSGHRGEVATYRNSNRLLGHSIVFRSGNTWPSLEHAHRMIRFRCS